MASFKDLRKKISLKRFHQKIDEFEERIEEKIKQCWKSMISSLSDKSDKKVKEAIPKVEEIKSEDVKIEKFKDNKKIKPPLKTKKAPPSKSNKAPVKAVNLEKKTSIKAAPKPVAKSKLKSISAIHVDPKKSEIKKDNDVENVKPSSPDNLVSITSKKRGRPKKGDGIKIAKSPAISPPKITKKSKNTKKSKK